MSGDTNGPCIYIYDCQSENFLSFTFEMLFALPENILPETF